jgi:hypothetical protein
MSHALRQYAQLCCRIDAALIRAQTQQRQGFGVFLSVDAFVVQRFTFTPWLHAKVNQVRFEDA